MQFIIVADDDLAPLGRQIAHALSIQKTHSGAFWSVKHYKDNEAQLRFLKEAGCHLMQGYLKARPLPPEEVAALVSKIQGV